MNQEWNPGDKGRLARLCDISPSHLSDILHGRKTPRPKLAARIEEEASKLGYDLPRLALLYFDPQHDLLD